MPTGTCNYPAHHGPSSGPPIGFLAALVVGALIVAEWHAVVIVAAVVAVLAVLGVGVVMLVHSHRSVPYDAAWAELEPHVTERLSVTAAPQLQARVAELERQLAARQIEAPAQHLHLHGLSPDAIAALSGQLGQPAPIPLAIETDDN
jgi:hypothetical protein